jgi:two-component system, HptB-dependent secretion and biofilm response regulator
LANKSHIILIVDDMSAMRLELSTVLKNRGYHILEAQSGMETIKIVASTKVDLVLMDGVMDEMDGFEACATIKNSPETEHIPILMVTSLEDSTSINRAFEVGADDYITKPVNYSVLAHRLEKIFAKKESDVALLQAKVDKEKANKQLAKLNTALMEERTIVENVLLKIHQSPLFDSTGLRIFEKAVERTTGDIVCAVKCANNNRRVLLGDFTGHGLTAAIAGPMVSEIFYSNAAMEMPCGEIFRIFNLHLLRTLDTDMFMACSFVELDSEKMQITMFNAGLANIIIFRDGKIIHKEPSSYVPRGLLDAPDKQGVVIPVQTGDRIIMYTDGFEEATDPSGKMFGEQRFFNTLEQTISQDRPLDSMLNTVLSYCQKDNLEDDVTLVELKC